jgi:Recombination endonuclease VII
VSTSAIDITEKSFGEWKVLSRAESKSSRSGAYWLCKCSCGTHRAVSSNKLRNGTSLSCGGHYRSKSEKRQHAANTKGIPACDCKGPRAGNYRMCALCHQRWHTYTLHPKDYFAMLEFQAGLCGICTKPMNPAKDTQIDHCHRTGAIRMLLCRDCNNMIGKAEDDPSVLTQGAAYVRLHSRSGGERDG